MIHQAPGGGLGFFFARETSGCGPLSVTEGTRPSQTGTLLKQHTGEGSPGSNGLSCRCAPLCASQKSVFEENCGSDSIALCRRHLLDMAPGHTAQSLGTRGWAILMTGVDGHEEEEEEEVLKQLCCVNLIENLNRNLFLST